MILYSRGTAGIYWTSFKGGYRTIIVNPWTGEVEKVLWAFTPDYRR